MSSRIALILHRLGGGGDQRIAMSLANALVGRGFAVDMLAGRVLPKATAQLLPQVRVIPLRESGWLAARLGALRADPGGWQAYLPALLSTDKVLPGFGLLPAIAEYLRREPPAAIYSVGPAINMASVLARRLAGARSRLVLSERVAWGGWEAREGRANRIASSVRRAYMQADGLATISNGLASDLALRTRIPPGRIQVVYNPVNLVQLTAQAEAGVSHDWFAKTSAPVLLGVGRLSKQKDFATLLRAFAEVRQVKDARLVIVGDADNPAKNDKERAALRTLARDLGVAETFDLVGYQANPYAFMRGASLLVSSSRMEGFSNVILEALACGTPVVSTDCPFGPREILKDGAYGRLVPVGDHRAMAEAILATLDAPPPADLLKSRARDFDFEDWVTRKLDLLLGSEPERIKVAT